MSKMKRFCRITLYIEQKDPKLAEVIDQLCLFGKPFAPMHYETGVTFLYPDSAYQKEIIKNAIDDPELAHKMVKSLIISGYYPNPQDFGAGQLSNRLGQVVEVKEASPKEVVFKNGAVATVDSGFNAMEMGKDNSVRLAVYLLKGKLPIDSPAATINKSEDSKTGGYDFEAGNFKRDVFMKRLEDDYAHKFFARDNNGKPTAKIVNPYLEKLASLLTHIKQESENRSEQVELYNKVMGLVDFGVQASMYILIEPYKTGTKVIPDAVLSRWKEKGYPKISGALDVFKSHLNAIGDHTECIEKVNAARQSLMEGSQCTPWELSSALVNVYKQNIDEYGTPPMVKMQQDEIRFIVQTEFDDLEYRRQMDMEYNLIGLGDLRDLFKSIKASHNLNKNNPEQLLLMQSYRYSKTTQPRGLFFNGSFAFLRSSAFLYHSVKPSDGSQFEDSDAEHPAAKGKISLFNRRLSHVEQYYENRTLSTDSLLLQVRGLLLGADQAKVKTELQHLLESL